MKKQNSIMTAFPVLFGFFVMGFCDIVGISSDYVQRSFNWSPMMTGFVPSMVFVWFLFLGIPIGNRMNKWGRKNTVLVSMVITIVGMILPLLAYDGVTCMVAYALLGIGNAILQVSLNPLLNNVITNKAFLTSSLTVGQVIKAASSLVGPEIVLLAVHYWGMDKWYYCFPILGFITLLSTVWLIATPIERERNVVSDGKHDGEHASIMYNKKKIELLEWGNFWLSSTPEIPSIGWDAACTRTATWALLKDKKTMEKFYYVNTHLDHVGRVARKEGLNLILEKIQKINPDNFPLILTGDFNMEHTDSSIQKLNEKMIDARTSAKKTDSFGTFNGWGTRSSIIDYIYYKGFKMCTEYVTIREKYAGKTFISDHYPIKGVLKF